MSTHCSQRIGHFRIKVRTCPNTAFYGWDTSELRFGSVLWTLQNLNSEVSKEHFRTFIRKCPTRINLLWLPCPNLHCFLRMCNVHCCDMGQNDTIGKIELNPLSSCQVIILIARMTFNCFSSCLMRKCLQRLPLTPPGVMSEANSGMTLHSLVLRCDSFSCNCNSINSHLSIGS